MTDFMDTALNYQAGIRIAPDEKRWVITNGITQMRLCEVCRQPIYEGHIDCTCVNNHPENCDRPTYDQLKAQHDALVAALEAVEWSGEPYRLHARCPMCYGARKDSSCSGDCFIDHGHTNDCQQANALEQVK